MKRNVAALVTGAVALAPAIALAQTAAQPAARERSEPREPRSYPAPSNALEITAGTGYTQGLGMIREGLSVPDVATSGVGFDLGIGYRMSPRVGLLAAGQYQALTPERGNHARGLTTSVAAQFHFAPTRVLDPWLELGAGYRFLWETPAAPGPTLLTHGIQLARARVGLDVRASEVLALGPVVGADLNMFLFQDVPGQPTNISDPRLNTFVFAGVQGRFDVGGTATGTGPAAVARR